MKNRWVLRVFGVLHPPCAKVDQAAMFAEERALRLLFRPGYGFIAGRAGTVRISRYKVIITGSGVHADRQIYDIRVCCGGYPGQVTMYIRFVRRSDA